MARVLTSSLPAGAVGVLVTGLVAVLVALGSAASVGKGKDGFVPFIVGGDDALPGQFPELVSVQVGYGEGDLQHLCGGFIIDQSWVVTAGHCLDQVDPEAVSVLAGATDVTKPGPLSVRVRAAGYEIHEDYDPDHGISLAHDIALINLAEPIPLNQNVQVASLQNVPPKEGAVVAVAGWGQTKNGLTVASNTLQWTKLAVLGRAECQAANGDAVIRPDQICAASTDGLHAECKGDSGGALFEQEGLVVGIVSWSQKPCGFFPGVFSSIPAHYSWIRDKTGLENL